jgi:YebC/PmpR family DNA-binding regulatory protein
MGRAFEFRKERKMKRWAKMSKIFSRLNKDIIIAIKDGGNADPETNSTLRAVLQNCKAANMPKDNIERAIKKATDKDTSNYKEVTFEGYGPHGIAMFIETATDNNNRTVASIRSDFSHNLGNLGTTGNVEFLFNRVCFFNVNGEGQDAEELELELIDHGAEEIEVDDDTIVITAPFGAFGAIQKQLEAMNLEIQESGFDRVPTITSELNKEQTQEVEKLIEKLEENDDVQNVYHTLSSSSE